jgi:hypothetical protein
MCSKVGYVSKKRHREELTKRQGRNMEKLWLQVNSQRIWWVKKYKKRKNNNDFTFNEKKHVIDLLKWYVS